MTNDAYIDSARGEWALRASYAAESSDEDDSDESSKPVTFPGTAPKRDDPFQKPGGDMPAPPPPAEIEPGPSFP